MIVCIAQEKVKATMSTKVVEVSKLINGDVLAYPVVDANGKLLLSDGTVLTDSLIEHISKTKSEASVVVKNTEQNNPYDKMTRELAVGDFDRSRIAHSISVVMKDIYGLKINDRRYEYMSEAIKTSANGIISASNNSGNGIDIYSQGNILFDEYLHNHSVNVSIVSMAIAAAGGMTDDDVFAVGKSAALHDIGKKLVPQNIINKNGALTSEEFDAVKQHTEVGYRILMHCGPRFFHAAVAAKQHHERFDGSGYPAGLSGSEIAAFSKIISMADVYDALTSNRCYKKAYLPHDAYEYIIGNSGSQFDPEVVNWFMKAVAIYPVGLNVVLNTGQRGVVIGSLSQARHRPIVRVDNQDIYLCSADKQHIFIQEILWKI